MQINKSTDYAIKMMLTLAEHKRVLSSAELVKNIAVSKRYLLQIAAKLRDGELIGANMGPTGGFHPLYPPDQISIYDILLLMEGEVKLFSAVDSSLAYRTLYDAFLDLEQRVSYYLKTLTLDLLIHSSWNECLNLVISSAESRFTPLRYKVTHET